jgi:hypothetical protein
MKKESRYVYLLIGLTAYLLIAPLLTTTEPHMLAVPELLLPLCFAVGVISLLGDHRLTITGGALVLLALAFRLIALLGSIRALDYVSDLLSLAFCVVFGLVVLRDVLRGGTVDLNRVFGAVCVYLLLGISWSILFELLEELPGPDAFRGLDGSAHSYVYFSFVTLTTLGFGDIVPLSPAARTLVYLEAAVGQLYLTILVAALVGRLGGALRQGEARD